MADTVPGHKAQWSITGLPDGLTADLTVGKLSGTPTASGAYSPEVTVTTRWGSVTRNISLVVVNLQAKYTIRQGGEDLDEVTLPDLIGMIRAGTAQAKYNTDDTQLVVPWTNPLNGTVYACPMDFCSFRDVELEDGTIKPGLILQCGYGLPHYGIQFDKAEKTRDCGDTRWRTSNIRQWLNAKGRDWFTPTHDEDKEPFT